MTFGISTFDLGTPGIEVVALDRAITIVPLDASRIAVDEIYVPGSPSTVIALIPGPSGGDGPPGSGFGTPQQYIAMSDGNQSFPVGGGNALLFCNGLIVNWSEYSVAGGILTTAMSYDVMVGDIFMFIPF